MTYFRIQSYHSDRLLDGPQTTTYWSDEADDTITVPGKAVCVSREALAAYIAESGWRDYEDGDRLVELEGTLVGRVGEDAGFGVLYVHPTRIVNVTPVGAQFEGLVRAAQQAQELGVAA